MLKQVLKKLVLKKTTKDDLKRDKKWNFRVNKDRFLLFQKICDELDQDAGPVLNELMDVFIEDYENSRENLENDQTNIDLELIKGKQKH